jgi:DNA-binding GntR family transcriptional regulator
MNSGSGHPAHQTKTELALRELRGRIHRGELRIGQRLRVGALTEELGMSPTPIREALRLLEADRLVDYEPHRGVVVARPVADSLADVYGMRLLLEPYATELAIQRMSDEQRANIELIHQQLLHVGTTGGGAKFASINSDWHWAIYQACGVETLQEFIHRLWSDFPWRTNWALEGREAQSMAEHESLMAALRTGDSNAGANAMQRHIAAGSQSERPQSAAKSGSAKAKPAKEED